MKTTSGSLQGNKLLETSFHRCFFGVAERDRIPPSQPDATAELVTHYPNPDVEQCYNIYIKKELINNKSTKPDLAGSFSYRGREREHHINYEWYDIVSKTDLPDIKWQQVYIVGNLDGKVPVVEYENNPYNLPGGHTENNETIEQTADRECQEELNCNITSWEPIGYQKLFENGNEICSQLRIYAKLKKLGEFEYDPGGSVIGYKLVDINELNNTINWQEKGKHIQSIAKVFFDKKI